MSAYPQTNENATAVLSLQSTGHPDVDYEPTLAGDLDEQIEAEPPPGWEADMERWELERAEKAVEDAHAERAAQAAAWVRRQIPAAGHVFVSRDRREHFHADGRRIVSWQYAVSLLRPGAEWFTGIADSYDEAARIVVANAAAKGAA